MIEDVVVEAVGGEDVAAVVDGVERPVVAEPLGAEDEDAVVAELVVLDDGEGLERLAEADGVGDDAAAVAGELIDGRDDAVALEGVELVPDDGATDARRRADDAVLVEGVLAFAEEGVEDEGVDLLGGTVGGEGSDLVDEALGGLRVVLERGPLGVEPGAERGGLPCRLGGLDERERVAGGQAEPVGGEREGAGDGETRAAVRVSGDEGPLRDSRGRGADLGRGQPVGGAAGEGVGLEPVAGGAVGGAALEAEVRTGGWHHDARGGGALDLGGDGLEGEERQGWRGEVEASALEDGASNGVEHAFGAGVAEDLHGRRRVFPSGPRRGGLGVS